MILKSMCDFVEEQFQRWDKQEITSGQFVNLVEYYRMFLKRDLKLEYFIECDKDGNVLKNICTYNIDLCTNSKCMEYKNAKQRVLFEGFEHVEQLDNKKDKNVPYHKFLYNGQPFYIEFEGTIERIVEREFELTPTAQKLIGL